MNAATLIWRALSPSEHGCAFAGSTIVQDNYGNQYMINSNMSKVIKLSKRSASEMGGNFPSNVTMLVGIGLDHANHVYVSTDAGIFKLSKNAWVPANKGMPRVEANAHPFYLDKPTGVLYVGTFDGLYALAANSTTWQLVDDETNLAKFAKPGTRISIENMSMNAQGKLCLQTDFGVLVQE